MFTERLITMPGRAGQLCGAVCEPESPDEWVVMAYPFAEERKLAQSHYVRAAREMARRGIASLRFDFHGCGNSGGRFREGSVRQWVDDLLVAGDRVRRLARCARMSAMGLRLGSNLILLAMEAGLAVDRALLWNPIPSPAAYWREQLRRSRIASTLHGESPAAVGPGMAADLAGNEVGAKLADELCAMPELSAGALPDNVEIAWFADRPARELEGRFVAGAAFWTSSAAREAAGFVEQTVAWFSKNVARATV